MKYPTRIYYTQADKGLMWDRWQKGDSMHVIAGLFERGHSSVSFAWGNLSASHLDNNLELV